MRLAYFIAISIGLMTLFYLAGIDTGSSLILNFMETGNSTTPIGDLNPDFSQPTTTEYDAENILSSTTLWQMLWIALFVFVFLAGVKITLFGNSIQVAVEAVLAGIAGVLFYVFVVDAWSIISYTRRITNVTDGTEWIFFLVFTLGIIYISMFVISLIQFIVRGSD